MANLTASVDQGLFNDAIEEVRRLEGLLLQRKELPPDAFSKSSLFAEAPGAPITWEKALADAVRIEQKSGGLAAPKSKSLTKVETADERAAREREALEKMRQKFAELGEEETTKAQEKPEVKKAEPVPVSPATGLARPGIPAAPAAKPAAQPIEDEKVRLMHERLSRVLTPSQPQPEPKIEAARPVTPAPSLPATPEPQQQPAVKKTLFEIIEEKKALETVAVPAPKAKPAQPAASQRTASTELEKQIKEEAQRKSATQSERIDALKKELAEKVRKRKEEEEKKKKVEELSKKLDETEDS